MRCRERDVIRLISMLIINPGVLVVLTFYLWAIELNLFFTYLIVDVIILICWVIGLRKRFRLENSREDRTEIIYQKIDELKKTEHKLEQEKSGQ